MFIKYNIYITMCVIINMQSSSTYFTCRTEMFSTQVVVEGATLILFSWPPPTTVVSDVDVVFPILE